MPTHPHYCSTTDPVGLPGRVVIVCVLLLVGASTACPAVGQEVGAGAFARMGFDARGVSLGNAQVADPSADVAPHYNPALLASASGQRVAASAAVLSYDRQLQSLEFTTPLGPTAGAGLSLIHAGVSGIDGRNADGAHTETLSTDEFALSLSFGNAFAEWLSVGAAFTLYQSEIVPNVDPARGIGVDLAVASQVTERLHVAATVSDLLAKYEWKTASTGGRGATDRFPVRLRVGGSYTLHEGRVRLLGEVESRFVGRDRQRPGRVVPTTVGPQQRTRTESVLLHGLRARVGASYQPLDILTLRGGLDRLGVGGTEGVRPSAGFGIRQEVGTLDLRLSYGAALEPYVRSVMHLGTLELFL